ncbi:MAG: DUF5906 domain-containing protein [Methanobacterium sp.]
MVGKEIDYVAIEELETKAKKIALASKNQIKNGGKTAKSPAINWDKNPTNYSGVNDERHGTGLVCSYIPELDLHFVVIDLDNPKKDEDIPIEKLKSVCLPIIEKTYCTRTPSGGVHIYLLSRTKPQMKEPSYNIDYQANTGKGRGKYICSKWRWDDKGESKVYYTKLPEAYSKIAVVGNTDKGLQDIISKLEGEGLIKNKKTQHIDSIIDLLKPCVAEGQRQNYSCCIAGYLRKQGYEQKTVEHIIERVFDGDEELDMRLNNVERTYQRDKKDIIGWKYLKEYLPPKVQTDLITLTQNDHDNIEDEITRKIAKHQEPSSKLLFDYISLHLDFYIDLDTLKYYENVTDGSFVEIDEKRIINFFIEKFGTVSISRKRCQEVLKHIINPIEKDYNLLEFDNGILNTETREFTDDKSSFCKTPKLRLPFNWDKEAKGGKIEQIISDILDHPRYPDDKQLWIRSVGHAFMGYNRIGKIVMVQGPSGTGKSTLTTILKRIFNYSQVPTNKIVANERFTLYEMIEKDVNIDDDINNGMLRGIGNLNTIITGNGLEVEIKGENKSIKATNPQIPRLFANGNTLPPLFGEGFERRLLWIHSNNIIDYEIKDDTLQNDILLGRYDKRGLEWLVYTAINTYWEIEGKSITTPEQEALMKNEYDFKSYPLKVAIEGLYEERYEDGDYIEVSVINKHLKRWCKWAYAEGKISKEHRKPSNTQIKKAMDHAGYDQELINIKEYDELEDRSVYQKRRVYADIVISKRGKEIIRQMYRGTKK